MASFVLFNLHMSEETQSPEDSPKFDARLAEGVAYFEKMLEIMPEDRTTLEFLVVAYEQLNEPLKGQKALVDLTNLLIKDRDLQALEGLLPRLQASDYEPAKILALRVGRMTAPIPELTPELPKELTDEEKIAIVVRQAVSAEQELVTQLAEGGLLTEEMVGTVRAQLDAVPTDGRIFLVSALQILEKENSALGERVLEFLADKYGTPPIPLAAFDVGKDLIRSFPAELVRLRGLVPFAKLGRFTLVATLNPADEELRAAAEAVAPCRFFLADATAVEEAIAKAYGETGGA